MALTEVRPVIAKDFVTLKIDTDRMVGGEQLLLRYAKTNQGIPWSVFLDADGKELINTTSPDKGNIGFPAEPFEIAHFRVMLEKTARRITPAEIEMLAKSLEAFKKR